MAYRTTYRANLLTSCKIISNVKNVQTYSTISKFMIALASLATKTTTILKPLEAITTTEIPQ